MQDAVGDREVLTPPRKKVREEAEELPKGIRKAPPTKLPLAMRVGEVQVPVKVPPQRKQPPLVKHAAGVWDAASGSDSWRAAPLSQMLFKNEDASSMTRLRILPLPSSQRECSSSGRCGSPVRHQHMKTVQNECVRPLTISEP